MTNLPPPSSTTNELAYELLDVTNESELQAFARRLLDVVSRETGRSLPRGRGRHLRTVIARIAAQTLPTLATGSTPDSLGGAPQEVAARVYGLETEGLSAEDRDYEVARRIVDFARAAISHAASSPSTPNPAAVRAAVDAAAQEFAPGLRGSAMPVLSTSGAWFRRGSSIVLTGLWGPGG